MQKPRDLSWQAIFFFLDAEMCAGGIRAQVKLKMCSGRLSPSESHDHVCWRETEPGGHKKRCTGKISFSECFIIMCAGGIFICGGVNQLRLKYSIVCADGLLFRVKALNMCAGGRFICSGRDQLRLKYIDNVC